MNYRFVLIWRLIWAGIGLTVALYTTIEFFFIKEPNSFLYAAIIAAWIMMNSLDLLFKVKFPTTIKVERTWFFINLKNPHIISYDDHWSNNLEWRMIKCENYLHKLPKLKNGEICYRYSKDCGYIMAEEALKRFQREALKYKEMIYTPI